MTKLLNLTMKLKSEDRYDKIVPGDVRSGLSRLIEIADLAIKDQAGNPITELKIPHFPGNFQVADIKNIKVFFPTLDIPISWAWKNKGAATEIEFTLQKLKYDESQGLKFSFVGAVPVGTAVTSDTLFLGSSDFEGYEVFKSKRGDFNRLSSIIKLSDGLPTEVKQTWQDFSDLRWEIIKAEEDEQITRFISKVESWQNAPNNSLQQKFYQLKNINGGIEAVKNECQDYLKELKALKDKWPKVGIKTRMAAQTAKENDFDIIANPSLESQISSAGKYQGFPIASLEKYKTVETSITTGFSLNNPSKIVVEKNRYTKTNIDEFRKFFTNDLNQSDPKYFRGFRPGDIKQLPDGKVVSVNHQADIRDKTDNQWEIKKEEDFPRTYYEMKTYDKQGGIVLRNLIEMIFEANDLIGKTKKEILDTHFKWTKELGYNESKGSKLFYQCLTNLFWVLERNFINENRENCETALNTLKTYESLPDNKWVEKKIKNRYSAEIETKKNEVIDRMKMLFQAEIDAAANEDYGSGRLSSERKSIFTTHRSQIENLSLLTEIKQLIKSLVKAERFIAEFKNLDKMASAQKLKEEYRNGSGDKKTAYTIVNQVDNQWVDRIITELEIIKQKDPQFLLAESRTQLKLKYADDAVAQAIFDNQVLDSVATLQATEKLLIKVREAEAKNDVDMSLLTFLQSYQAAEAGSLKNKAWQAVNSHNQQAEAALAQLQKVDQSREEAVKALQEAKNKSELERAYNRIKDSELYKKGGPSKRVINNLWRRKQIAFQLEQENFSVENKIFLQTVLGKLIPETLKNDNDEAELTALENQLKTFQTASESEEKGEIYQKYKKTIDQILTEIRQEKQRYQQTKLPDSQEEQIPKGDKQKPSSGGRLPDWAKGLIILGIIVVTGTVFLYFIFYFHQRKERRNLTK